MTKWEEPIQVKGASAIALRLSPELLQKAKRLAAMHKISNYQEWLEKIIKERIQLEADLLETLESEIS